MRKKRAGNHQAEQRLGFADTYRHPAMRQGEHFDDRDKVEKDCQPAEVNGKALPAFPVMKDGGEDGDTRSRVKNRRHSEPKQDHSVVYATT